MGSGKHVGDAALATMHGARLGVGGRWPLAPEGGRLPRTPQHRCRCGWPGAAPASCAAAVSWSTRPAATVQGWVGLACRKKTSSAARSLFWKASCEDMAALPAKLDVSAVSLLQGQG